MRYLWLCIVLLVQLTQSSAQGYKPFVKENAYWNVGIWGQGSTQYDVTFSSAQFSFNGDTLFRGRSYKRLYKTRVDSPIVPLGNDVWAALYALVREDSNSRVYVADAPGLPQFYNDTSRDEHLLYDFDVKPGEALYYKIGNDSFGYYCQDIDSVYISGHLRKRYYFGHDHHPSGDIWVEGIGSIWGFFYPYLDLVEGGTWLGCYFDDSTFYQPDTTRSCIRIGVEEYLSSSLRIYPNPTSGKINIDLGKLMSEIEINIFNQQGKMLDGTSVFETSHIDLEIPGPPGFYMISLTTGAERATFKVMKL